MLKELKAFLIRGSVLELAVGVIIGSAFGKIVSALVDKILMPLMGVAMGGIKIQALVIKFLGVEVGYGAFFQAIIDFTFIGIVLFFLLRIAGKSPASGAPAEPPPPTPTESLLAEIRDLLQERREKTA